MLAQTTNILANPGLVRRYCSCAIPATECCDLPQRHSGWTVERLAALRREMQAHGSVQKAAEALGESLQRCGIALFALLGRSPAHALAALERQAARS